MWRRAPVVIASLATSLACRSHDVEPRAATGSASARSPLEDVLGFEGSAHGGIPAGWSASDGTVAAETTIVHSGHGAVRIVRSATSPGLFSTVTDHVAIDFAGATLELRGYLRTDAVTGRAGLWMREDGETSGLAVENMKKRNVAGTTEWAQYSISLPVDANATTLYFGVRLEGAGTAWADDLELLVDGKPIWEAPHVERPMTALDRDTQFDGGSGITATALTPQQIDNLVVLGRVWGFLKYHHPRVTSGQVHWDYELLRVLPTILAATDRSAADAAIARWIASLGAVPPCGTCTTLDEVELAVRPDVGWIDDRSVLGPELSKTLHAIYDARVRDQQFYVSLAPGIGNPVFRHERDYSNIKLPDPGFQLLALFRLWNIVEYWAPDRGLAVADWAGALRDLVPKLMLAKTSEAFELEMMAAIALVHDSHAGLWSALRARPPTGDCQLPFDVRFVDRRAVAITKDAALQPGDVITTLDGVPIPTLVASWMPYYSGSNEASRLRDIATSLTRGACGGAAVGVDRNAMPLNLTLQRTAHSSFIARDHDLAGPTFRLLSPDVAYLKLSSVKADDVASYVQQAASTTGLIVDIRNYPSDFVVFALGGLLVAHPTPFARFTSADLSNPGAFHWGEPISIDPEKPHYAGKVVVMVDEVSQSQAEYTAMALRAAGATVVGSTTAGADGNVSPIALPVGLRAAISGLGVFYPDKGPTQVIGIVPNVRVEPTIAGIRAGRDEVLEAAIRQIVGPKVPAAEIERIARPKPPA